MTRRELIAGPNFSGRSAALRARLDAARHPSFFIGPYAEAALSGLSSTVTDEIAIYRAAATPVHRTAFTPLDFVGCGTRKPQTLSGGEQVLLALHCFSQSAFGAIAIDTALEQLDAAHRKAALDFVNRSDERGGDVALIDNRLTRPPHDWSVTTLAAETSAFACDPAGLVANVEPRRARSLTIRGLDFRYPNGADVFRGVKLTLEPGQAYRVFGANGAGKTTLLKLLVGVLAPSRGTLLLDGADYAPWRHGNAAFALATQNPDHQWCGATLREDIARRRAGLGRRREIVFPSDQRLAEGANKLGVATFDQHLYELPLAARKRLSWLWPLSGAMPWLMFDEPTIGQDSETRARLAAALTALGSLGYGVVFVTHDDDFARRIPHRVLSVADQGITADHGG